MKKRSVTLGLIATILLSTALAGCSNSSDSKASKSDSTKTEKTTKTKKAEKPTKVKTSDTASDNKWTFKNDVFSAGILTYKLTKSEIRDSVDEGKKVLVIYTDVTNNSTKEQDPSNIYMVMHAYQKTDTADKDLDPGMVALDADGNNPLQQYDDALHDQLLPGKTTTAIVAFTLENTSKVTVKFDNSDFKNIGNKTYDVQ